MELFRVIMFVDTIISISTEMGVSGNPSTIQQDDAELSDKKLETKVSLNGDSRNTRDVPENDNDSFTELNMLARDTTKQVKELIRIKRGKRQTQTDTELIIKLLNNINQKQNLLIQNQKQIIEILDKHKLLEKINTMSDVTSIIAASLVNKNNVPFIPDCQETVKDEKNDIDTCLQPQIAQLYPYLGVPVRLVGSSKPNEGRVEVYYKGRFTTVCDHGWGRDDARVVCNSLGYTGRARAFDGPRFTWGHKFGEGEGLIMIYLVHCKGDEDSLLSCEFEEPPEPWTCSHGDDAGVKCEEE